MGDNKDYVVSGNNRISKKCNEDDVTEFRNQVDNHFNNTKNMTKRKKSIKTT